jgi:hypothetical protein
VLLALVGSSFIIGGFAGFIDTAAPEEPLSNVVSTIGLSLHGEPAGAFIAAAFVAVCCDCCFSL